MGVVHLARHPEGHRVAVKVLRPSIVGDDEARARLAREVSSLSRIRSRWVAEIIDADPWGPIPFVAMRYVPGLAVSDYVREEGPIRGHDLTWFARHLAEGLQAVHDAGVLHRDVKPGNVLMEGRAPILIDFGLARVAEDPRLTHTGWLLGTPGYLAPEILHGEDATSASDIHSWAATVAFAGTGRPPFGRGPAMAIMDRVRRGAHDLTGLDEPVRSIVEAAMCPHPGERPTMVDLRCWLDAGEGPAPVDVPEVSPEPDPYTVPLAIAAGQAAGADTRSVPPPTRLDEAPPGQAAATVDPPPLPPPPGLVPLAHPMGPMPLSPAPVEPVPLLTRARRSALTAGFWALAAATTAWVPYLAVASLTAITWTVRAAALSGRRQRERRWRRGTRWYDPVVATVSYPWFLVVAVPGALLLTLWALGLAVAVGLFGFALHTEIVPTLAAGGAVFGLGLWWGPGSRCLREPTRRVLHPVSNHPVAWLIVTFLAVLTASLVGSLAVSGPSWTPASGPPFPWPDAAP